MEETLLTTSPPELVEIGDSVIFQNVNDEAVLLSLTTQDYYGLDDVGAVMWNLLLEHQSLDVVVERLSSIYDSDAGTLRSDLETLVGRLMELSFLKAVR